MKNSKSPKTIASPAPISSPETVSAATALVEIPLALIIPTPENPRIIRDGDPRVAERAESIKALGQLQPILVRPHPTQPGKYDLRGGELRYRAMKLLGRPTILAIVRDMDDSLAKDITITENIQRDDFTPMEEARGILTLLADGRDYRTVAEQIGKSAAWVCRRKALAELAPCWTALAEQMAPAKPGRRKHHVAMDDDATDDADADTDDTDLDQDETEDDGDRVDLTVAHLELLARFPRDTQERIYQDLYAAEEGAESWRLEPGRFGDFERYINEQTLSLKGCGFDPADPELLDGKPACAQCLKRASVNPGLFDDACDSAKLAKNDQCLDRTCFEAKCTAGFARTRAQLQEQHPDLQLVRTKYSTDSAVQKLPEAGTDRWYDRQIVKETTPGAKPALVAHGPGKGSLVWIVANRRNSSTGDVKPEGPKTLKQKRHELTLRRRAKAIELFKANLAKHDALWLGMHWEKRAAIITLFPPKIVDYTQGKEMFALLDKRLKDPKATLAALWKGLVQTLHDALRHFGGLDEMDDAKHWCLWNTAGSICTMLGLDIKTYLDIATDAIPEPKAWAAEEKAEGRAAPESGTGTGRGTGKGKGKAKAAPQDEPAATAEAERTCRVCGCTEANCAQCVEKTGEPCHWVAPDLCSACATCDDCFNEGDCACADKEDGICEEFELAELPPLPPAADLAPGPEPISEERRQEMVTASDYAKATCADCLDFGTVACHCGEEDQTAPSCDDFKSRPGAGPAVADSAATAATAPAPDPVPAENHCRDCAKLKGGGCNFPETAPSDSACGGFAPKPPKAPKAKKGAKDKALDVLAQRYALRLAAGEKLTIGSIQEEQGLDRGQATVIFDRAIDLRG
jgi:ParB/RepB/Spo0J family partition protein